MPGKPELRPLAAPRKAEPLSAPDEKQKDGSGRAEPQYALMTQEDDDPMQAWLSRMVSTGSEALMPLESRSSSLGTLSSEIMHSPKYSLKRHHTPSDDVDVAEDDARKRQCAFDFFAESMHSLRAEEQVCPTHKPALGTSVGNSVNLLTTLRCAAPGPFALP